MQSSKLSIYARRAAFSTSTVASSASNSTVKVGLLLRRNPLILRELTEFERAYYKYREDKLRKEARHFDHEFYFKKGSVAEQRWLQAQKAVGADPLRPSPTRSHSEELAVALAGLAERTTEADSKGDEASLDRRLDCTLYLACEIADSKSGSKWVLPDGSLQGEELLHEVGVIGVGG
jgi:large subunit ribosomal protein L46